MQGCRIKNFVYLLCFYIEFKFGFIDIIIVYMEFLYWAEFYMSYRVSDWLILCKEMGVFVGIGVIGFIFRGSWCYLDTWYKLRVIRLVWFGFSLGRSFGQVRCSEF